MFHKELIENMNKDILENPTPDPEKAAETARLMAQLCAENAVKENAGLTSSIVEEVRRV